MSSGPCLCGDPYCPSCGDPGAAAFESFIDGLVDELSKLDEIHCRLFVAAGKAAVAAYDEELVLCKAEFIGDET